MQYPQIQFYKGSLVRLATGQLKQVEDLSSDDFLESARLSSQASNCSASAHHATSALAGRRGSADCLTGATKSANNNNTNNTNSSSNNDSNVFNFNSASIYASAASCKLQLLSQSDRNLAATLATPKAAAFAGGEPPNAAGRRHHSSSSSTDLNSNSTSTSSSHHSASCRFDFTEFAKSIGGSASSNKNADSDVEVDVDVDVEADANEQRARAQCSSDDDDDDVLVDVVKLETETSARAPALSAKLTSPTDNCESTRQAVAKKLDAVSGEQHCDNDGVQVDSSIVKDFLEVNSNSCSTGPSTNAADGSCSSSPQALSRQQRQQPTVLIKFLLESSRQFVFIEVPVEHPFFVFHKGWSSWNPQRTFDKFSLKCRKLKIGDTCISLIRRRPSAAEQQ